MGLLIIFLILFVGAVIVFGGAVNRHKHEQWSTPPEKFQANYRGIQKQHGQDLDQ